MRKKQGKNKKQKNLGLLENLPSIFSCHGSISIQPFKIFYQNKNNIPDFIQFPNPKQQQIQSLISNSKISGFGKHNKNVVDEEYRKAYQVLPENMGITSTVYQIIASKIYPKIGNLLNCSNDKVWGQLIKLNIYGKGCFFKSHVDSPKQQAFGSLVIFLPSDYEGGILKISHGNNKQQYKFEDTKSKLNWVGFYNDCVHQITEVTKGCRLTLSYNLYYSQYNPYVASPNQNLIQIFRTLQKGKVYGYFCEHYYGNHTLKNIQKQQLNVFKGKDAHVWLGLTSLKFKTEVKVLFTQTHQYYDQDYPKNQRFVANPSVIYKLKSGVVFDEEGTEYLKQRFKTQYQAQLFNFEEVTWLNSFNDESKYIYAIDGYYGNDYSMSQSYCELIIVIHV